MNRHKRKNRKKLLKKKEDDEYRPTEVLSQDEIDVLLTAMAQGDTEPETFTSRCYDRRIKIYDFKRPDKFSKEQIRTVSIIHETIAKRISTVLSSYLRHNCNFHVASVDQLTYEEFIRSIPTPTTLSLIGLDPLKGSMIMEIDPAISFAILDILYGGSGSNFNSQHELTELEQKVMENIILKFYEPLKEGWEKVFNLSPSLKQLTTNPYMIQIVPASEMVILVTIEARIEISEYKKPKTESGVEGMINICLPAVFINPIMDKLCSSTWYSAPDKKEGKINKKLIQSLEVDVVAELGKKILPYGILNTLNIGDDISFEKNESATIKVNNHTLFEGDVLSFKDNNKPYTVKLTKKLDMIEDNYMETKNNVVPSGIDLNDVAIQITAELGRTKKQIKDILTFGEGTIVELDKLAGEPVDLFANNVLIARGEVVVIDENFGVRITELIANDIGD
jgi:flagellar motor switch protein FliM